MGGLERGQACHPERSEGSLRPASEILRCAQDDMPYLQMPSFVARLYSIGDERWYNCCNILISHHLHGSISLAVCSWDGFTGRSNI